jgi:hypothetical protein
VPPSAPSWLRDQEIEIFEGAQASET